MLDFDLKIAVEMAITYIIQLPKFVMVSEANAHTVMVDAAEQKINIFFLFLDLSDT